MRNLIGIRIVLRIIRIVYIELNQVEAAVDGRVISADEVRLAIFKAKSRVISRNLKTGGCRKIPGGVEEKFARSAKKNFYTPPTGCHYTPPTGCHFLPV